MLRNLVAGAAFGLALVFAAGPAAAEEDECDPKKEECAVECDPKKESCDICHNIGGPRELGANCDNANADEFPCAFLESDLAYAGIIIGASDNALDAHLKHGDGFVLISFDPPLHLASEGLKHQAANVECVALRATTEQPPEPGN
jgi:hypothetical protein